MPNDPESAPIHNINHDVLLHIFTCNADMLSDRQALHTTRITSQVCRQWHDLILGTPFIWAKLIDMDHICKRETDEWRDELVRRSGTAPLWIRTESSGQKSSGPESPHDRNIIKFFIFLVSLNCDRIQKLVILGDHSRFELIHFILVIPAPRLEHCEISLGPVAEDAPALPFFHNQAPMLRVFHLRGRVLDCRAPWLRHLRSIVLDRTYHVLDALKVLLKAQSLQELIIEGISHFDMTSESSESLPIVSLSHLKYLEHNGFSNRSTLVALLDHIQLPVDYSLIIRTNNLIDSTRLAEEKSSLLSLITRFTQHAEYSLKSHVFKTVNLTYNQNYFISFTCQTSSPSACLLSISIPLNEDRDASLAMFLKKLQDLDLTTIKRLNFTANRRLNASFGPFFSCLPSVDVISTDLKTLSHLAHLQKSYIDTATNKQIIMFPVLDVVDLHVHLGPSQTIFFVNQVAAEFLLWRLKEGRPISTVDMSTHLTLDVPPNLDALAKVKGLKVHYKLSAWEGIVEHTCGGNVPETYIDTIYM